MLCDHGWSDVSRGCTGCLYCYWSDACSGCGGDGRFDSCSRSC